MTETEYTTIRVESRDQVATVTLQAPEHYRTPTVARAWELGAAFSDLRGDNSVRVVVLTGEGGAFGLAPTAASYASGNATRNGTDPHGSWLTFTGIVRCHQTMAEMEKPIIAKVNGDAIGFAQSLAFACDLIVATEDARFVDHHMGGTITATQFGHASQIGTEQFCAVPGDGGMALVPLFMTPVKAKEALMLAKTYRGHELARMNVINYAVPADQLDAKVDELVQALLQRNASTLAWTKRVVNRHVVNQLNLTLDASVAYEMAYFGQQLHTGGVNHTTLA
jgi:enoyl-CoA hydratase